MITCTCYNKEYKFSSIKDAKSFFITAYYGCDSNSSEAERYANILMQIDSGKKVCNDMI